MCNARIVFALLFMLAGCATIVDVNRAPPADWPALDVVVQRTTEEVVRKACSRTTLIAAYGCTVVRLENNKCYIFLATDDPATLEHERLHCLGYDHVGDSFLRDMWARHKGYR